MALTSILASGQRCMGRSLSADWQQSLHWLKREGGFLVPHSAGRKKKQRRDPWERRCKQQMLGTCSRIKKINKWIWTSCEQHLPALMLHPVTRWLNYSSESCTNQWPRWLPLESNIRPIMGFFRFLGVRKKTRPAGDRRLIGWRWTFSTSTEFYPADYGDPRNSLDLQPLVLPGFNDKNDTKETQIVSQGKHFVCDPRWLFRTFTQKRIFLNEKKVLSSIRSF